MSIVRHLHEPKRLAPVAVPASPDGPDMAQIRCPVSDGLSNGGMSQTGPGERVSCLSFALSYLQPETQH